MGGNVATGNCDGLSPCTPVSRLDIYDDGVATPGVPSARANDIITRRFCERGRSGGDAPNTGSWDCVDDYSEASSIAVNPQSVCIGGECPASTATFNDTNMPPWMSPQLIAGVPPALTESGPYWIENSSANHGNYHRGNGILCAGGMGLNGIFDYDETCNTSSWISPASVSNLGNCPSNQYAIGIDTAGQLICATL
jgi:hypothetical protein